MALCISNITIGVYSGLSEIYIKVHENKVTGLFGDYYDQFLVHKGER